MSVDAFIPTPSPAELSPRRVRIGLRWNIAAGCMAMVWLVLPGMPLTMLMEAMGAEAARVGVLVAIQQAAMVLQVPGAILGDRFKRRKPLWAILSLLHRVVWFLPVAFWVAPQWASNHGPRLMVWMAAVSSVFGQLSVSAWHAWMADLIPENQRSRFWGIRQSILWITYLPAVLLFGYLLDVFPDPRHIGGHFGGFALVFGLGGLAGCLDVILHLRVPEPAAHRQAVRSHLFQRFVTPFRNRDFGLLTLGMSAWHFSLGLIGAFGVLFLSRAYGLSYTQLSILGVSSSLAGIVSGFLWGYLIKRTGARSFCLAMLLVIPFLGMGWFLMRHGDWTVPLPWGRSARIYQPVLIQVIMSFLGGMFYSGVGLCQLNLLAILTPRLDRAFAMAGHWTAVGLGSALGPLLAGHLVDRFERIRPLVFQPQSFSFGFMHLLVLLQMAVVWGLVLPAMAAIRNRREDLPLGVTLARLFVGNPLRLMGNVLLMDTSTSPRQRMRAIKGFGRQRFSLALDDLVQQLNTPSTLVREAACVALGRIGGPLAVRALAEQLSDPENGLSLQALQALGATQSADALPVILPWVRCEDRVLACTALRALARLGDSRAIPAVVAQLRETPFDSVRVACVETLSALGAQQSVPLMLETVLKIHGLTRKRLVATAAMDLLAPEGSFFRLMEMENRHPGTLTENLLESGRMAASARDRRQRKHDVDAPDLDAAWEGVRTAITAGHTHDALVWMRRLLPATTETAPVARGFPEAQAPAADADGENPMDPETVCIRFLDAMLSGGLDESSDAPGFACEIPLALFLLERCFRKPGRSRRRPG